MHCMFDIVGNRTSLLIEAMDAASEISVDWTCEYNRCEPLEDALLGGLGDLGREVAVRVRLESEGPDGTGG